MTLETILAFIIDNLVLIILGSWMLLILYLAFSPSYCKYDPCKGKILYYDGERGPCNTCGIWQK